MREKLIELLSQDKAYPDCKNCKTPVGHCNRCVLELHVDHLIANGVTVQQWIPVSEPPTKEGWYHVAILDVKTGKYSVENDLYAIDIAKAHGHTPGFCKASRWKERERLTHWMPYPEPPKEG